MEDKINILRDLIHKELIDENLKPDSTDYKKILELSQKLDSLIVEYYKKDDKKPYWFFCLKIL